VVLCPALNGIFNVVERLIEVIEPALTPILTQLGEFLVNNLVPPTPLLSDSQMRPGDLMADLPSLQRAKPVGIHAAAMGGAFAVNCDDRDPGACEDSDSVGMDIAMQLGFEAVVEEDAEFPAGCIQIGDELPRFSAPTPVTLPPRWEDANGNRHRYAVGFGLAESGLNQLGWALFTSGVLCIDISTADMGTLTGDASLLTTGIFGLLAGEILALAGPEAPVLIRLRPTAEPRFDMIAGAGPREPQMSMAIEQMKMEVFIGIDRRFVRAFAVMMDIDMALQLSPEADQEGNPVLVIQVADGPNVGNFEVVYDEPVAGSDLGATLPALIDLVMGNFLQDALRFEIDLGATLTEALGTPVNASVDHVEVRGAQGDELVIYANLATGERIPSTIRLMPSVIRWDRASLLARDSGVVKASGEVRLQINDHEDLAFSYRVDGGPWRSWRQADEAGWLTVGQPKLALVGRHRIELRARPNGDWRATPTNLPAVTIRTSALPPEVRLRETANGWDIFVLHAGAAGSTTLLVRWGEEEELTPLDRSFIERAELAPGSRVEIIAEDGFGRRSAPARIEVGRPLPAPIAKAPSAASGCSAVGGGSLLLLGLLGLRRRRLTATATDAPISENPPPRPRQYNGRV
jgi:hypothetical protein